MLDPKIIGTWIGVLVAAGGVIAGAGKFVFWVFDEIQKRKVRDGFSAPKKSLQLAPKPDGSCWWAMGKMGNDPTMQVVGRMFVTNIASVPVRIPQAELRHGFLGRKRVSGTVSVSRGMHDNLHGMFDIGPNETRDLSFDFWIYPPVTAPERAFVAWSIRLFDQFGNPHIIRKLNFRSMQAISRPATKEPEEFPFKMSEPIEKEVVSVLKAEVSRYEICGRRAGGLGSIHIVYRGHPLRGVGNDSWTSDSPSNQLIVPDPDAASLVSDNLDALTAFYGTLSSPSERERFATTLLDRLEGTRGYLSVSYFIVCVLWKIGYLSKALSKAKTSLPEKEDRVFGLSNVLMLLNGLLRYRYQDISDAMLDEIEGFVHGLNEHLFLIPAKLATIRAGRLSARKP